MTVSRSHIPFYKPWTDAREIAQASGAIRSGWLTTGPRVGRFEERIRRMVRSRHAVAVNS